MADAEETRNEAPSKEAQGGGGMLGPALALVVTLIIGIGLGMLILRMIAPEQTAEEEQAEEEPGEELTRGDEAELLDNTGPMTFEDVITNLKGELSRYIKVEVQVWFDKEDEHYQKITTDERVRFMLQEQMIEELRTFDPANLEDTFVLEQMKKGFRDRMDRELRASFGSGSEKTFVKKVVIKNFILQ